MLAISPGRHATAMCISAGLAAEVGALRWQGADMDAGTLKVARQL